MMRKWKESEKKMVTKGEETGGNKIFRSVVML